MYCTDAAACRKEENVLGKSRRHNQGTPNKFALQQERRNKNVTASLNLPME